MINRILKKLPALFLWLILSISGLVLGWLMMMYLENINVFEYKHTEIIGNQYISDEIIKELASIDNFDNIVNLNFSTIGANLKKHDYIKDVRISKKFPSTIRIDVIERELFAFIQCKESKVIIDEDGFIFPYHSAIIKHLNLPILKGDTETILYNDLELKKTSDWFLPAFNFICSVDIELPEFFDLCTGIYLKDDYITFDQGFSQTCIRLKKDSWDEQLIKLTSFSKAIQKSSRLSDYREIDLRISGQVIVIENKSERS
ncbi:MAG: FtsQ-type POTRA domain-containing protein [Candidatus Marinimicrobia bacterium]|jgi:hypothetical protein|nr:FtsQ-type POTRA domain-containing protein [Candidatus Neomarinimicrobiota bacterium]MBT3634172.1 FtsQ-type POTRA domain-containing protein [Candidatus Neomarinimicrobiota bacterium]MBT3683209.1 FtsQ-type POTRA domain-containing protein [Candidatus Neomarinimicrobiota bacterium]MBT3759743.1 FtsQ-type POTRA domain-containing protein [Candidatus Neomarinimicrobiota bacterium]MBT3895851.1 FtsQ-type POTRA domain-containing protein [Candidatus Neomarinimicrobiota bacterium]